MTPARLRPGLPPLAEPASAPISQAEIVKTVAAVLIILAGVAEMRLWRKRLPDPLETMLGAIQPFRSINSYGLFAVMTTTRPEIIVEGSDDGEAWRPYEFKWKPGALDRPARWVAPHQPRLDWQMWFAALGSCRGNPWFLSFQLRLLQGSSDVLALLDGNPFPNTPPRYVRSILYQYRFTDLRAWRERHQFWEREEVGPYCPTLALENGALIAPSLPH